MLQTTSALAGLGLFFTGLHLLAASIQPLVGGRMRTLLTKITDGPVSSAFAGSLLGAISQSTSAAAFICIGLLNSGALPFQRVLALIGWSSVGTSLLVFLAAIDVRVAGLYVVGLVGIAHLLNANRHVLAKQIVYLLFALGVLLLGLGMVKEGSATLRESLWVREFMEFASEAGIIGFLIGVIITLIVQSSASVTILAATLHMAGVLQFQDAVYLVFGSSVGSGMSVVLATSHLNGRQRQLAIYQCLVKIAGVVVLLPFCWISPEWLRGAFPALLDSMSTITWIAVIYLLLQIAGAFVAACSQRRLMELLDWLCPSSNEEELFAPQYIYPEAAEDLETALVLAKMEQDRLVAALADYLEPVRPESERTGAPVTLKARHEAASHLAGLIKSLMEETAMHNHSDGAIERIFALQSRNEAIISLQDSLYSFAEALLATRNPESGWSGMMVEGLHFILLILRDSLEEDSDEHETLLKLTEDRSKLMENVRNSLLTEKSGELGERQALFISTGIFERIVWMVRQMAMGSAIRNPSSRR
jgi:phosphate:Na+ symporter